MGAWRAPCACWPGGSGATPIAAPTALGPGAAIIINNRSKYQAKKEDKFIKHEEKCPFIKFNHITTRLQR